MTAYSGLWNGVHGENHALLSGENTSIKQDIRRIMRRQGARKLKELMLTLNGASAGSAALATYARVEAVQGLGSITNLGGVREIETVTVVNRNTASADKTMIDGVINDQTKPSSYPTDASGNGGGGKLGF